MPRTETRYYRPASDSSIGEWTDDLSGTTNIYQAIDEASPSDTDYIQTANNPSLAVCELGLTTTNIAFQRRASPVLLKYRYGKSGSGGRTIEIRVRLLQGTGGTEVVSQTHTDVSNVVAQNDVGLTQAQMDLITDFDNLFLEVRANWGGSGAARRGILTWAELSFGVDLEGANSAGRSIAI
jgi:hypothetical protein